jgi:hypothetical protein
LGDIHVATDNKGRVQTYELVSSGSISYSDQQAPDFDDISSFLGCVAENVRVYFNSVHDTLYIEMYIL